MKKAIGSTCLAALLSMGMTTAAAAQTEAPQPAQENTETKGDDSGKYGLAGLLGLLGLAGLKRNRHDADAHRESARSGAH